MAGPLVSPELFDRVQQVLALHGGGDTRDRTHHHYLKGLLWCGRCGRRLIISPGRGNGGTYFYYICIGRQSKSCQQPFLRVEVLEAAVSRHYATVRLSEQFCKDLRDRLEAALIGELAGLDALRKRLNGRLLELNAKEDQYLDLVGSDEWPTDKIKGRLKTLRSERDQVTRQLADTKSSLDTGREIFLGILALLSDPQAFYAQVGTTLKRAMNALIFGKLRVDGDEISGHELTEAFRAIVDVGAGSSTSYTVICL